MKKKNDDDNNNNNNDNISVVSCYRTFVIFLYDNNLLSVGGGVNDRLS